MITIEIAIAILLIIAYIHFRLTKRKVNYQNTLINNQLDHSTEMKKTLAMGLYLCFKKEEDEKINYSSLFIKQDPLSFEYFVAEIFERARGGKTWVSPPSGDFGVDFEHDREIGKYYGQVKCYKEDLDYKPIALVHSRIVKDNADGGYVITTGSFTRAAKEYAQELNIELIDGVKLVELWLEALENAEEEIEKLIPSLT
ncbi:restriction endonuclease [Heyndrickxia shackletonii]|uniref:Restriction endonuclease n=1 Tax=Heyndrickxia shackletonii TaxID=157838 RepID=A0A0Q3WY08_9BACI|nr:restriction endonuclease [Heyndrickxia shackletonii]KQL54492.1 restriction endonuclease [Heyndrickxia shackletonii]NEY99217.1 restriction endonuclease [Heyndrickxia shackletonii]